MNHLRDKQVPNNATLTKSKVDAKQASEAASASAQRPPQEKTEIALAKASQTLQEQAQTQTARQDHSDFELLKHEYEHKTEECESLMRTVDELNARVETLRNDFSAQNADDQLELLTLQSLLEKSREETEKLLGNTRKEPTRRSNPKTCDSSTNSISGAFRFLWMPRRCVCPTEKRKTVASSFRN